MHIAELKAGTVVQIEYYAGSQKEVYDTTIVGVKKNIVLAEKITKGDGAYVKFPTEMIGNLLYNQRGKLYVWPDIKIDQVILKKELYYKITLSKEEGEYTNRRNAFRLFVGKQTRVGITTAEGVKKYSVILKDVSETGFGFVSEEEFDIGKRAEIRFEIAEGKVALLNGHIVRIQKVSEERNEYIYGCALSKPSDFLAKYIMKQQMQGRNR